MKTRKRLIALLLVVYLMISLIPATAFTAHAVEEECEEMVGITHEQLYTPSPEYLNLGYQVNAFSGEELVQRVSDTYYASLEYVRSTTGNPSFNSFDGLCATLVDCEMVVVGINTDRLYGNGNVQYDNYAGREMTSGGYAINKYPAANYSLASALNAISNNGTKDVYDILIGFETGYGTEGALYGHCVYIHGILQGQVYFCESFGCWVGGRYYNEGDVIVCSIDAFCAYYNGWTTLDGVIHFTKTPTYISECIAYPTYGTIQVTNDNANIMDRPCSTKTDSNAVLLESGKLYEEYTVTELYENTAGNFWYEIIISNGSTGYIYSGNCAFITGLYGDVNLKNSKIPTELAVGNMYTLGGTISSPYTELRGVSFYVYDSAGNRVTGNSVPVSGKSYELSNPDIDYNVLFDTLSVGEYQCVVTATVYAHRIYKDKIIGLEYNLELLRSSLSVYNPSSNPSNPGAETASFVKRSDGVWLWPTTRYAVSDWAGCNAAPGVNSYCYFCGVQHGTCAAYHQTTLGHNGIDIPVTAGSDVYAAAAGTLYCTNTDWPSRGITAVIEHPITGTDWSYYSVYQHLQSTEINKNGTRVNAGDRIAKTGATDGYGTGQAHLHFGVVMGASGQGSALAQNPNNQYTGVSAIENCGWILNEGYATGRILPNPALNSPAGEPVYTDGCGPNVKLHAGSVMYTFNKEDVTIGAVDNIACTHNYSMSEVNPTCTETGLRIYLCLFCGHEYSEAIPAYGHQYYSSEVPATCSSMAYTAYTCLRCADYYVENPEEGWSDWSGTYPEGVNYKLIQSRTEYRYQDKETTISTSDSLPGWTLIGSTVIYGDYGTWSEWSDTPVAASETTKVETRTVWPYYYFLCTNCGAHMHGYGSCWNWAGGCGAPTYDWGWREVWSTVPWDSANLRDWYGTGKYYTYIDGELVFQLSNVSAKTQYRYCTREATNAYEFYRWGDWSDWTTTVHSADENRNVETRTAFRHYIGPLADHTWDEGVVTKSPTATEPGIRSYTCLVCEVSKTETISALGVPFTDVAEGTFYYEPVMWAVENGVTSGTSETTFDPSGLCLRAHVVTFLYRAAGSSVPSSTKNPFTDVKSGDFFFKPVLWAVENGITQGISKTQFGSTQVCNRAAVVTFLWRAFGSPEPKSTNNPFVDVKNTDFFYKPVLWAVENGITAGIDATHFNPAGACNRAQVVTFLYRAYN